MDKIEKVKEWVKKQKKEELARNSIGVITGKALFVDANELLSFLDTLSGKDARPCWEKVHTYTEELRKGDMEKMLLDLSVGKGKRETKIALPDRVVDTLSEEPMQKFNTDKLQEIAKPATPHKKPTPEDRTKFMEELHEYAESKKPDKDLEEAAEAYQQQVIEETKNHIHLPQHTYAEGFEDALHLISDAFIAGWEYRGECEESPIMGDLLKTILRVGVQHNFGFGPDLKQCKDNEDESK